MTFSLLLFIKPKFVNLCTAKSCPEIHIRAIDLCSSSRVTISILTATLINLCSILQFYHNQKSYVLEALKSFYLPIHAVPGKRVAVSCTVTWATAILMKAPVSHHTPVAFRSADSRFANAVSVGRVAQRAIGNVEGHGAHWVTSACWKVKRVQRMLIKRHETKLKKTRKLTYL